MTNTNNIIGTYTLTEETVFDVPQEYAGAAMSVRVPAGKYPVEVKRSQFAGYRPYIAISLPGVVVSDYFLNRLGGHTSARRNQHVGAKHTHTLQPEPYILAELVVAGKVRLNPDLGLYTTTKYVVSTYAKSVLCKEYADESQTELVEVWRTWSERGYLSHTLNGREGAIHSADQLLWIAMSAPAARAA